MLFMLLWKIIDLVHLNPCSLFTFSRYYKRAHAISFWFTFQVNLCSNYFCNFQKGRPRSTAYINLCSGVEYLLEARYITLVFPNVDFWFLRLFVWAVRKHCLCLKKRSQKWTALWFGSTHLHQTFTECVTNQKAHVDVLIWQM